MTRWRVEVEFETADSISAAEIRYDMDFMLQGPRFERTRGLYAHPTATTQKPAPPTPPASPGATRRKKLKSRREGCTHGPPLPPGARCSLCED